MIPKLIVDFDTAAELPRALAQHRKHIHFSARRLARRDSMLQEDLIQEAAIRLWEMDPSRFDADDAEYVERELQRRMSHAAQRDWRERGRSRRVFVRGW